jgi:hypothetical protein
MTNDPSERAGPRFRNALAPLTRSLDCGGTSPPRRDWYAAPFAEHEAGALRASTDRQAAMAWPGVSER